METANVTAVAAMVVMVAALVTGADALYAGGIALAGLFAILDRKRRWTLYRVIPIPYIVRVVLGVLCLFIAALTLKNAIFHQP
jgi:hypothetical protein